MADGSGVFVKGLRELSLRFDELPRRTIASLEQRVQALTDELESRVKGMAPKKTGKLESEIVGSVKATADKVSGLVRVTGEFPKAAALEYGVHTTRTIKSHSEKLTHLWARAVGLPMLVTEPSHTQRMDLAARRFLRVPLEMMRDEIETGLRQAVDQAIDESN